MAYLEITKGKAVVQSPLGDDAMSIGRQPGNSIVINDPDISRRHCVIEPGVHAIDFGTGPIESGSRVRRGGEAG